MFVDEDCVDSRSDVDDRRLNRTVNDFVSSCRDITDYNGLLLQDEMRCGIAYCLWSCLLSVELSMVC